MPGKTYISDSTQDWENDVKDQYKQNSVEGFSFAALMTRYLRERAAQRATDAVNHLHVQLFPRVIPDIYLWSMQFRDSWLEREYYQMRVRTINAILPFRICCLSICLVVYHLVLFSLGITGDFEAKAALIFILLMTAYLVHTQIVTPEVGKWFLIFLVAVFSTLIRENSAGGILGRDTMVQFSHSHAFPSTLQSALSSDHCFSMRAYKTSRRAANGDDSNSNTTSISKYCSRNELSSFVSFLRYVVYLASRRAVIAKLFVLILLLDFCSMSVRGREVLFATLLGGIAFVGTGEAVPLTSNIRNASTQPEAQAADAQFICIALCTYFFFRQREYEARTNFYSDFHTNVQRRRTIEKERVHVQRMEERRKEYREQIFKHMNERKWVQIQRGGTTGPQDTFCYNGTKFTALSSTPTTSSSEDNRSPEIFNEQSQAAALYQCWKIPFYDIEISHNRLGVGSFGMVHEGSYRGKAVAVKQLLETSHESIPFFVTELSILSKLAHPNIVKLIGAQWEAHGIFLVLAYCTRRDLETCLVKEKKLEWQIKTKMLLDIAHGMAFMHDKCICHRDLKPSNVLVHDSYSCCIADFESACNFGDETDDHTILVGTPIYIAPEMLEANENRSVSLPQSDVYSFGITCIAVAISPYLSLNQFMILALGSATSSACKIDRITDALNSGWRPVLDFGSRQEHRTLIRRWIRRQNPAVLSSKQMIQETVCDEVEFNLGDAAPVVHSCWNKEPGDRTSFSRIVSGWQLGKQLAGNPVVNDRDRDRSK